MTGYRRHHGPLCPHERQANALGSRHRSRRDSHAIKSGKGNSRRAERKIRHDLGREEFLQRVRAFAQESHDTIVHQVRRMGASLDWSREAYTLDDKREIAVRTAFKKMYDLGLIYRGNRMVNWDPKGRPRSPTTRSSTKSAKQNSIRSAMTRRRTSLSQSRPRVSKRSSATPPSPCIHRTSATRNTSGKNIDVDFCGTRSI